MGIIHGVQWVNKFGRNEVVDMANDSDVWDAGRVADAEYNYSYSATDIPHTLVSTSTDDTAGGTGARTVLVIGQDGTNAEIQETVSLNGMTPVSISNTFLRVYRMIVETAGSGGENDGDIILKESSSATAIQAQINKGNNQSLMAIYTVPAGKLALLYSWYFSTVKKPTVACSARLMVRPSGEIFRVKHVLGSHSQGTTLVQHKFSLPLMLDAGSDIKVRCSVDANGTDVTGGFDIALFPITYHWRELQRWIMAVL